MYTSYAVVLGVRPAEAKTIIEEVLAEQGVTGFEVSILSVAAAGYTLQVTAEETRLNLSKLIRLFGELNLKAPTATDEDKKPSLVLLEQKLATKPAFSAAGKEGRFARENPPPVKETE